MSNSDAVNNIIFGEPNTLERFNKAYAQKTEEEKDDYFSNRGAIAIFKSDKSGEDAVLIGGGLRVSD